MDKQDIVIEYPPMYEQIADKFDLHPSDGVIFSWGDVIYNPGDIDVGPELLAHELAHGRRQGTSKVKIIKWWRKYMDEQRFRLNEEIYGHRAEYEYLMANGNRHERRSALKHTASRLAAPLYGSMITQADAKGVLRTH